MILSRTACWSAMYSPGSPSKTQPSEALDTSVSSMGRDASFSASHDEDALNAFFLVSSTAPPSTIIGRYTSSCALVSVPAASFILSAAFSASLSLLSVSVEPEPAASVSVESVAVSSGSSSGAISFSSAVTSVAASSVSAGAASLSSAAASAEFSVSSSGTSTPSSTSASDPAFEALSFSLTAASSESRISSGSFPPSSSIAFPSAANACILTGIQDEKATIAESSNAVICLCLMY